ncbi:MAG: TRASH domain-containing protein [Candidatus Omnitrophica bacterium]|nr:TRASH domain-containing protein [Candidatus Omnitrophota bacterium]
MKVKVSEENSVKVDYKGKIYNLCCGSCEKAFLKDPEAAIKILNELEKPIAESLQK